MKFIRSATFGIDPRSERLEEKEAKAFGHSSHVLLPAKCIGKKVWVVMTEEEG